MKSDFILFGIRKIFYYFQNFFEYRYLYSNGAKINLAGILQIDVIRRDQHDPSAMLTEAAGLLLTIICGLFEWLRQRQAHDLATDPR